MCATGGLGSSCLSREQTTTKAHGGLLPSSHWQAIAERTPCKVLRACVLLSTCNRAICTIISREGFPNVITDANLRGMAGDRKACHTLRSTAVWRRAMACEPHRVNIHSAHLRLTHSRCTSDPSSSYALAEKHQRCEMMEWSRAQVCHCKQGASLAGHIGERSLFRRGRKRETRPQAYSHAHACPPRPSFALDASTM